MHGLSSLALASIFAAPPGHAKPAPRVDPVSADPSSEQCRADDLDFFLGYGPADAPTALRLYIDPTASDTAPLRTWLEIRRIAGERNGELRIELVPTRGGLTEADAESDAVRLWFMAAAMQGRSEPALRLLDRQDWRRIAAELRSPEGRARLAAEIDIDAALLEARRTGTSGSCLRRSLDAASNHLAVQTTGQRASLVGIIGRDGVEQFQYVDLELTELRTQIDRLTTVPMLAAESLGYIPYMPPISGRTSRFDRTFPTTGVLVGGAALPHRLIIFVDDEEHGRLPDWLRPAMQYRTQNPGRLSVQLIAGGVGSRAISLRRRLCAARTLGLEVEFLLHLSEPPTVRRLHADELDEILQPVADSDACSDSEPLEPTSESDDGTSSGRRGSEFGHPRGAWLDGRPVNPSELDSLAYQLDNELAPSVIDWLLTPDNFAADGPAFEF